MKNPFQQSLKHKRSEINAVISGTLIEMYKKCDSFAVFGRGLSRFNKARNDMM